MTVKRHERIARPVLGGAMAIGAAVVIGVLAMLVLASCSGTGSAVDELERVAPIERGTPLLVFVYSDG